MTRHNWRRYEEAADTQRFSSAKVSQDGIRVVTVQEPTLSGDSAIQSPAIGPKLTRRKFEADVAMDCRHGSPRRAETLFGKGRATVKAGLDTLPTGVGSPDQSFPRGRPKTEEKFPDLEKDIRRLVEPAVAPSHGPRRPLG